MLDKRWNFNKIKFDLRFKRLYNNIVQHRKELAMENDIISLKEKSELDRSKYISIRVTSEEKKLIEKKAQRLNKTKSQLVRVALNNYLKNN